MTFGLCRVNYNVRFVNVCVRFNTSLPGECSWVPPLQERVLRHGKSPIPPALSLMIWSSSCTGQAKPILKLSQNFKKQFVLTLLRDRNGNQSKAAEALRMHRNPLPARSESCISISAFCIGALRKGSDLRLCGATRLPDCEVVEWAQPPGMMRLYIVAVQREPEVADAAAYSLPHSTQGSASWFEKSRDRYTRA